MKLFFHNLCISLPIKGTILGVFMCIALYSCTPLSPEKEAMRKTTAYLWSQQRPDGSWRSEMHGLLKGGQAYTSFILFYLLQVPDDIYQKSNKNLTKGLDYLRKQVQANGVVGENMLVLEYPNYATAYTLNTLARFGDETDKARIKAMQTYLLKQQWTEQRGITPKHPAYGGWGFGETRLGKGEVGHVDLSNTRRVLEALQASKNIPDIENVLKNASAFLQMCQKHPEEKRLQPNLSDTLKNTKVPFDGGFYYSPAVIGANKAKIADGDAQYAPHIRSYATATADGLIALKATNLPTNAKEVQNAIQWLEKHENWAYPEGIPTTDRDQWHTVMVLYHINGRAEAYKSVGKRDWQARAWHTLRTFQQGNGSFSNPAGARNKEDDPLLGSTLALATLLATL